MASRSGTTAQSPSPTGRIGWHRSTAFNPGLTAGSVTTTVLTADRSRSRGSLPTISSFECVIGPGYDVGAHVHTRNEEVFFVLEGELDILAFEPVTERFRTGMSGCPLWSTVPPRRARGLHAGNVGRPARLRQPQPRVGADSSFSPRYPAYTRTTSESLLSSCEEARATRPWAEHFVAMLNAIRGSNSSPEPSMQDRCRPLQAAPTTTRPVPPGLPPHGPPCASPCHPTHSPHPSPITHRPPLRGAHSASVPADRWIHAN